jgi:hypothetical protein
MDLFSTGSDEKTVILTEPMGASLETIRRVERQLGLAFPDDYVQFMQYSDGGTIIPGDSSAINLYSIEEMRFERDSDGEQYEGCVFFGSDGGLESYGFEVRTTPVSIVEVDKVAGMESAILVGRTLRELVDYVRHKFDDFDRNPSQ